jgi:RNA polymerase sigma factor (sigma-70 family)
MELDPHDAPGRLFADMYRDLRQLAERQLRRNSWLTVSATTLLHEAYIGMSDSKAIFPDEARFIGYAARVMRGVIIDLVRERRALKRGAGFHITRLPTEVDVAAAPGFAADGQAADGPAAFDPAAGDPAAGDPALAQLSAALDELAQRDPALAELVDLRYFCGYTFDEIAAQRGISKRTVQRDWEKARLLLFNELNDAGGAP